MISEDMFSNLAVIPFTLDAFTWHSAEQFFQSAKFTEQAIIEKIKNCSSPFRCAALGQTRKFKIRDDWEIVKVSIMERAIRARFEQHPALAKQLQRSKGKLYDHTASDSFWGIGWHGKGENVTGSILMAIRADLQLASGRML